MDRKEIIRAQQGDQQALAKLLKEHYSFVVKYLWKMSGNEQVAYDVTQETLTKVIQKIHQYNEQASFSTWIIQIATHTYLDMQRKQKRKQDFEQQERERLRREPPSISSNQKWDDVQEALWRLEEQHRVPIVLKHYYGYDYEEIARITKVKVGTIKSRVYYGLDKLRKELQHDEKS